MSTLQLKYLIAEVSRGSSVGTATRYGLDGPGIECRWKASFSPPVHTGPGAHPASSTMGNEKCRSGLSFSVPDSGEMKKKCTEGFRGRNAPLAGTRNIEHGAVH